MSNSSFAVDTKKIWQGILVSIFASILAAILGIFAAAGDVAGGLSSLAAGDLEGALTGGGMSGLDIVIMILEFAVIAGYVFVFLGISGFQKKLTGKDASNANLLKFAFLIAAAGALFSIISIPVLPWLCNIAGFVLMLIGYMGLKTGNFNEPIKKAFNMLFISALLYVIAIVISWIPVIGWIFAPILEIIAFIMMLLGWYRVKANS